MLRRLALVALLPAVSFAVPSIDHLEPATGPTAGGTNLTIVGSDFVPSSLVLVDSRVCGGLVFLSTNQLTCVQPAGAGKSVPVVVVEGGVSSNAATFSFFAPTITGISPSGASTSGGATLTISGDNFGANLATVTVGGQPCPIQSAAHTELRCTLPPGSGEVPLTVTVRDQQVSTTYRYGAPAVSDLQPSSGPTAGNIPLTINGANFGAAGARVTVGGQACPLTFSSHFRLICTVPQGQGLAQPVEVNANGVPSNSAPFSYAAPSVSGISPAGGPTTGGTPITITGQNFGLAASVTVGAASCPVTSQAHDSITCVLPEGQGAAAQVRVLVSGQTSQAAYAYGAPRIDAISPEAAARAGGTPITLHGANFGVASSVSVGGRSCPVTEQEHTRVVCTAPSGGAAESVQISVSGQVSNAGQLRYAAPEIASLSPQDGPTAGGVLLTLQGQNFGATGASVTVGGATCPLRNQTDATLTCTVPSGAGASLPVVVTVADAMTVAAQRFSYSGPAIAALHPDSGARSGGTVLTITGSNFGTGSTAVTVDGAACPVAGVTDTEVRCTTPPHASGAVTVELMVSGQRSNALTWRYADAPPVVQALTTSTDEDAPVTVMLQGEDDDGDALTYRIISPPAAGTGSVTVTGDGATFTPAADFHGEAQFTYAADDGELSSSPQTVTVTVTPVNDAPVALPLSVSLTAGVAQQLPLTAIDAEGDALTFALAGAPPVEEVTVALEGDSVTVRPAVGFTGTTAFRFTASDGAAVSAEAQVTLTVGTPSGAPVATDVSSETEEDTAVTFTLLGTDDGPAALRFAIVEAPPSASGAVSVVGSEATFTPARDFHGTATFTFLATDGVYTSAPATATVTVGAVNDAPVAESVSASTEIGQPLEVALSATDADGDPLTYSLRSTPEAGTATVSGSTLRYTPPSGFAGRVSFTFAASDGEAEGTGTIAVAVFGAPAASGCAAAPTGALLWGAATVLLALVSRRRR